MPEIKKTEKNLILDWNGFLEQLHQQVFYSLVYNKIEYKGFLAELKSRMKVLYLILEKNIHGDWRRHSIKQEYEVVCEIFGIFEKYSPRLNKKLNGLISTLTALKEQRYKMEKDENKAILVTALIRWDSLLQLFDDNLALLVSGIDEEERLNILSEIIDGLFDCYNLLSKMLDGNPKEVLVAKQNRLVKDIENILQNYEKSRNQELEAIRQEMEDLRRKIRLLPNRSIKRQSLAA